MSQLSRRRFVGSQIGLLGGLALASGAAVDAAENEDEGRRDSIKDLLQARLIVLTKVTEMARAEYEQGTVGLDRMLEAQMLLHRAELALCETKAHRIEIHQKAVKTAKTAFEHARSRVEAAVGSPIDALMAEASLLEARIGLEKAKAAR